MEQLEEEHNGLPEKKHIDFLVLLHLSHTGIRKYSRRLSSMVLHPKTEIRYIYNGVDPVATGGLRTTQHVAWRRSGNVSNKRIKSSHLMVQHTPALVGTFGSFLLFFTMGGN